uniref:Uncharacterized protein n=1 Tax=virus sp. ctx9V1 TaxID=2828001 RepID=A0A8S5RE87_9VIRU|nr:MAG TPA: hypothetical protein [virus sp. ctx9V1]
MPTISSIAFNSSSSTSIFVSRTYILRYYRES